MTIHSLRTLSGSHVRAVVTVITLIAMDAGAACVFGEPLGEMIYLPYTANTGSAGLAGPQASRP